MSRSKNHIELSKELLLFLKKRGYSHILSAGITEVVLGTEVDRDDYRLIPVKPDDPRLSYQETEYIISTIDSDDVKEMAEGVEFIRFMMEIPTFDFEVYLKQS